MREIKPFKTLRGLEQAIDNGGRFYNLFSHAEDSVVSRGELAKAAGVYSSNDTAFLFLEMARQDLSPYEQDTVVEMLEPELQREFRKRRPKTIAPDLVDTEGKAGTTVIMAGYPQFVENKTEFQCYIQIPVMVGKVTTYTQIPIFDQFDVYEVFNDKRMQKPSSVVARSRGKRLNHDGPIRFGGIVRKLDYNNGEERVHNFYVETVFYTKLQST